MSNSYMDISEITESMELYDNKPKKVCEYFVYFVFSIFLIILVASCFIEMEQYVKVQGKIECMNEEITIVNSLYGKIAKQKVENGQYVNKGDIIFLFEQDDALCDYNYYKKKLEDINEKKSMTYMYLMYLKGNKLDWDKYSGNKYYHDLDSRKKLMESQCNSMDDMSKNTFIKSEITKVYLEKEECENQYIEIKKCLDESEGAMEKLEVRAPKSGRIELNNSIFEGNTINVGQEIAIIGSKNKEKYTIEGYVDEKDVVNLKKKMDVKFDMKAYPAKEYEYIEGVVNSISDKAIISEIDGNNYYLIKVDVIDMGELKNDKQVEIKSGMTGIVKVLTSKKKLIRLLMEKLNFV